MGSGHIRVKTRFRRLTTVPGEIKAIIEIIGQTQFTPSLNRNAVFYPIYINITPYYIPD